MKKNRHKRSSIPIQDRSLQEAIAHHRAGRLQEAERLYGIILQANPGHPDANHNLGVIAMQTKRPEAALSHFKIALEADPKETQYWLSYMDALIQAGQTGTARDLLTLARERGLRGEAADALAGRLENPSGEEVNSLVVLFNQKRFAEVERLSRKLTESFPRNGVGWKALGAALMLQGRGAEALEPVRRAAEFLPGDAEAHNNLGNVLQEQGLFSEAEICYRRALDARPDFAEAGVNLANVLQRQGRLEEAETFYRRALSARPDCVEAQRHLGNLLHGWGRLADAENAYRRVLEMEPNAVEARVNLANILQGQGRFPEAEADYRRALAIDPEFAEVHGLLGDLFRKQGRFQEAEAAYLRALAIKPDFTEVRNSLGVSLYQQGRPVEAEAAYRKALTINPDLAEVHCNLGVALQKQGRLSEAEAVYGHALTIRADYAGAYNNLGNVLREQGRLKESEDSYRRAIAINPDYAEAHNNLGVALNEWHRFAEAEASCCRSLEIDPDYAEAHYNLGNAFQGQGRIAEAEAAYRRALEIKPKFAEAYNNLGAVLSEQGRIPEAEASCRRALEINPDYAEAYTNLSNTLKEQGRFAEAEECCRRALKIKPDLAMARLAKTMIVLPIAPQTPADSTAAPLAFDRALKELSDWLESLPAYRTLFSEAAGSHQPFFLAYRDGNHVERLSRYGDLVARDDSSLISRSPRGKRKRVRLAVVSCHLRRHSVWDIIIRGLIMHLDRSKFEVALYHVGKGEDGETALAKSLADVWRDVHDVKSFEGWLEAMQSDCPDVVFYPEIGMDPTTLRLASRRLAPLQAAGWGHPITTGLPTIDLFFSGELLEPPEADAHYRECLVRLPGTGCCTTPIEIVPEGLPELEAELALRGGPVFALAQVSFKFDPADDGLYADIAAAVGGCTFVMVRDKKYPWATEGIFKRLCQAFAERGMDPMKHLLTVPWLSREGFYRLLDLSDVYLDCPSFSGYTTAWQAIHRGLPVVTLEGGFMRRRLAAGLLRRIGMTDTIASCADEYVGIAARLAAESRNAELRRARREALKAAAGNADQDVSVVRAFERSIMDALAQRA